MGFKEDWKNADPENSEDTVEEIVESLMGVIRDEQAHPSLKIRSAEILLNHFKQDKLSLPPNLNGLNASDLSELQLIKIIKERSKSAKN